jgi:hypothetical protein
MTLILTFSLREKELSNKLRLVKRNFLSLREGLG